MSGRLTMARLLTFGLVLTVGGLVAQALGADLVGAWTVLVGLTVLAVLAAAVGLGSC